jgi:hypothetical protein
MNSKYLWGGKINKKINNLPNSVFEQVEDHLKNLIFMKRRKEVKNCIHIKMNIIRNEKCKENLNEKMRINVVFLNLLKKMNMNFCRRNFYYKCVNRNLNSLINLEYAFGSSSGENINNNFNFFNLFLEFCNLSKNKNQLLINHETIDTNTKRKILDNSRTILIESKIYTYLSVKEKLKFLLFLSQLNKTYFFSCICDEEYPIDNLDSLILRLDFEIENFFKFHLMCSNDFEIQSSYLDLLENTIQVDKLKFVILIDYVNLLCAKSLRDKISSFSENFHLILKTVNIFKYLFSIAEKEDSIISENIIESYIYLIKSTIELFENLKESQKLKVIAEILLTL